MLRACFNCYHNYTTDNVYQWDLNHVLEIKGLTLDYAPTVHFCNKKSTEAIVVQSELVGDVITVDVPNELLQEPYNIIAYIHTYDANNAKTIEIVNIPLIKRVKPSDYQFTGNVDVMNFERLEKDFTDFVNQVEADFLAYKEEANAHIDKRIDDFFAQNTVEWDKVLNKPENLAYTDGDTKDNVVTFTSGDGSGDAWTEVDTLASKEKHSSIFNKISTMFKNIRYLYKMLGTTDISAIGDGSLTSAIDRLDTLGKITNFQSWTGDNFGYDFLNVDTTNYSAECNKSSYIGKYSGDGYEWTNVPPVNNNTLAGYREVFIRSKRVMVKLTEIYPVAGREWYNAYDGTKWTGWVTYDISESQYLSGVTSNIQTQIDAVNSIIESNNLDNIKVTLNQTYNQFVIRYYINDTDHYKLLVTNKSITFSKQIADVATTIATFPIAETLELPVGTIIINQNSESSGIPYGTWTKLASTVISGTYTWSRLS